jgi:hypothetical protein
MLQRAILSVIIFAEVCTGQTSTQPAAVNAQAQISPLTISCWPSNEEEHCKPGERQICINAQTQEVSPSVVSLSKNDQVRVSVYNKNPFAYQYRLHLDQATIADDDVSGFLKLFLPAAPKSDVQQVSSDVKGKSDAATKTLKPAGNLFSANWAQRNPGEAEELSKEAEEFNKQVDELNSESSKLAELIAAQVGTYQQFAERYADEAIRLSKQPGCGTLQEPLNTLRNDAISTRQKLLAAHGNVLNSVKNIADLYRRVDSSVNDHLSKASDASNAATLTGKKGKDAEKAISNFQKAQKLLKDQQAGRKQLDDFKQSALRLECMYLGFSKTQIAGIESGVIVPLQQAAASPESFWRTQSVGPYDNPTTVSIVNQRRAVDPAKPLPPITFPGTGSSGDLCSKDLLTANDFAGVEYSVPSASSGSGVSSSSGTPAATEKKSTSAKTTPSPNDTSADDTGYEPDGRAIVHFGGQRFITAAGAGFGLLAKPEFVRVSGTPTDAAGNPTGTAVTNIVGLKSESDVRVSPFLLLHTRLFSLTHSPNFLTNEALFFSFGVGAQTDNQGARAEGLVGLSHSLADQRFFVTVGTYIGKQQVLKNGLFLGRDVSGLQGDLPIDQAVHFKLGVAVSWRFNIAGSGSGTPSSTDKSKQTGTDSSPK